MFQCGSPGSEFSGVGPRPEAVGPPPDFGALPELPDWQAAVTAGMAAAPTAIPMKPRREKRGGEPMRQILPRPGRWNRHDLHAALIGRVTIQQNLRRRGRNARPGLRRYRENGDKWPPTRPARHNGDHHPPPARPPSAISV